MSRRKSVSELQASGGWDHLSIADRKRRELAERTFVNRSDAVAIPDSTSSYVREGRPEFPKDLSQSEQSIFKATCRLLEKRGVLSAGDGAAIRLFAILSDRHTRAMEHLQAEGEVITREVEGRNGSRVMQPNPWLAIARSTERQLLAVTVELGLSPFSRDRIKTTSRRLLKRSIVLMRPEPLTPKTGE